MYRFPESLQADIRVHLNHSLFEQFEIFQGASQGSLRALATAFHIELFPHKHFLLKEGDQVTKLYFIVSGTVDVTKGDQSMVFLGKARLLTPTGFDALRPVNCIQKSNHSAYHFIMKVKHRDLKNR